MATKGHIKFEVTAPATNPLPPTTGNTTTMTVKATFIDTSGEADGSGTTGNMVSESSGDLTIAINYTQA